MLLASVWLSLCQVIQTNQNLTSKTADPPSAAILAIYLDQAHALPVRLPEQESLMLCTLNFYLLPTSMDLIYCR